EVQQPGYDQTGNTIDQSSATGGVTVALSDKIYTLTLPNTGPGSASGLNFGNIHLASALTASKTAAPAFTRTFTWQIAKAVDKTEIDTADGATFTYTVTVTRSAGTDSAWAVGGEITVSNANTAAAEISGISDAIDDANATCLVAGTFPATIPASASTSFTYACTYSAVHASANQTNTATPTFTRTYGWTISKAVDKTLVKQVGGSATFNYTVVAAQTGFVDSAWAVSGTITVSNPNDWEAITTTVSDAIDNGGTCTVTNGTNVSIAHSGSA